MLLVKLAKFLVAAAVIVLANLVIFMCFAIAVFGQLDFFYGGTGLLNLLVCGLTLRTVFLRRENHLWTALEFIVYGLITVSARFVITDLALVPSGVLVLAGLLTLVGLLFAPRPGRHSPYRGNTKSLNVKRNNVERLLIIVAVILSNGPEIPRCARNDKGRLYLYLDNTRYKA